MSNQIEVMQLSTTPIFKASLDGASDRYQGLVEYIKSLQAKDKGRKISNMGGWQSEDKLHQDSNAHIQWLIGQFTGFATASVANYLGNKFSGKLVLESSWANVNPRGCWNAPHMHLPADWSGVVYVNVKDEHTRDEREGNIVFIDPAPYGARVGRDSTIFLNPSSGMLVLFPSYLMHMVAPHNAESDRISIALNYKSA